MNFRKIIISLAAALTFTAAFAQVESAGGVRKRSERDKTADREGPKVSGRMQDFFETKAPHDADLYYMREIYRQLDLTKAPNSPLLSGRRGRRKRESIPHHPQARGGWKHPRL